ncbi:YggL family protein [Pseudoduganella violaceinigra]|uniref:YggL 50S ribosome-binding family protein n=1 Tax=Pseudoduganella violaceinigra TaxID=246602 RepID=UPI000A042BAB|nr:YggL family protein [Pseudoduganella violaceinigra]
MTTEESRKICGFFFALATSTNGMPLLLVSWGLLWPCNLRSGNSAIWKLTSASPVHQLESARFHKIKGLKMTAARRYNKRQLKKLHLGEFQELGFMVEAQLVGSPTSAEQNALLHAFLEEAIEANGLAFGGGYNDDFGGFVVSNKAYGKVEESHRTLVQEWLNKQSKLSGVKVGELRDAWYGWG